MLAMRVFTVSFRLPVFSSFGEMCDLHERKPFKIRDFLVIRCGEGNLLASPYFPRSGGMLLDWITLEQTNAQEDVVTLEVWTVKPRDEES